MTKYTVTATPEAEGDLARLWMQAADRSAVSQAANAIDGLLREDASLKGSDIGIGLRQLIEPPLIVEFSVQEDDRTVTIRSVRHIGEVTNGH
jgi:plasmid stabilization system protein ParE